MKKFLLLVLCLIIPCMLISACSVTQKKSTIKYERRFAKYLNGETSSSSKTGFVDLSEGPKTRYEANFGPNDLNFDFKVENPY